MRKSVFIAGLITAALILGAASKTALAESVTSDEQAEATPPVMVEVVKGDSLSKIANNHQTTYIRLFDANDFIEDPNVIHPGQQVRIPGADEQLASRELPKRVSQPAEKQAPGVASSSTRKFAAKATSSATAPVQQSSGDVWDALARCESGGNWSINTGNGYYGGLQFTASTWKSVGGSGLPHQNSREEQIYRGQILQARSGWGQWPACTKKLGLR